MAPLLLSDGAGIDDLIDVDRRTVSTRELTDDELYQWELERLFGGTSGFVYDGFSKDDNQWNWWQRYREFLSDSTWPVGAG